MSLLCHFTVYASRRLYAINKLPRLLHAMPVNMIRSEVMTGVESKRKCLFTVSRLLVSIPFTVGHIHSRLICALTCSKRVRLSQQLQTVRMSDMRR